MTECVSGGGWSIIYQNIMRPALGEVALDRMMPESSSSSISLLFRVGGGMGKIQIKKCLTGLFRFMQLYTRLLVSLFALIAFFLFFVACLVINNNECWLSRRRMLSVGIVLISRCAMMGFSKSKSIRFGGWVLLWAGAVQQAQR